MKNKNPPSKFISRTVKETHKHAASFAKALKKNLCHLVLLEGPLGAGKTEWARGFVKALTKTRAPITSPTYSIVNAYGDGKRKIYHVDLYRLKSADDLESVGFWDFLSDKNVVVVEWGEMLPPQWPGSVKVSIIKLDFAKGGDRSLEIIQPLEQS